jgi:hypothetical protein
VRRFPLVLGLLLAGAIGWPTYRRARLNEAVTLMSQSSEADAAAVARNVLQFDTAPDALPALSTLAAIAIALLWITLTSVELSRLGDVGSGGAARIGLAGVVFVLAAGVYRWIVLVRAPKPRVALPPPGV